MAVTFPTSPTNGQTFTANGLSYVYNATYGVWRLNVSAGSSGGGGGVTTYATVAELPLTGNSNGDMAFVEETDRLYLSNDNGWFNIALINTSPTITQGGAGSYALATDGTPTVITLTATDPEEVPLTWSYSVTSGALGTTATVTQADNVFTITPGTTDPTDAGTFELTFSVTDGTNIVSDVNSFSLVFSTIVQDSKYTVALITTAGSVGSNSTFTDSSANSLTLTPVSNPSSQSFSPYRAGGYSVRLDGSTGWIDTGVSDNFGTGDVTFECWVKTSGGGIMLAKYQGGSVMEAFQIATTNGIMASHTASGTEGTVGTKDLRDNQWHHLVFERYNGTYYYYADGELQGTLANTENAAVGGNWIVGKHGTADIEWYDGEIRDLKLTVGTAVYAGTTPAVPTEPVSVDGTETLVLFTGIPYGKDLSPNNGTFTANGGVTFVPEGPYDVEIYDTTKHGGSIYFTTSGSTGTGGGTGQYVQSALSSGLALDTNDFTISCWVYGISKLRNYPRILQIGPQDNPWGSSQLAILYKHNDDNDSICLAMQGIGVNAMLIASGPIYDNQWYHVAVTRSGTTFTLYINGQSVGTYTSSGSATGTGDKAILIGSSSAGDSDFNGYIADVRVVNGTAVYTTDFTPPTEPLSSTGAALHVIGNDADILDKSQTTTLTLSGNTTSSTAQTKYASSSIYLDGTGDYIVIPSITSEFSTLDFTVEFWVYMNDVTSDITFFGRGVSGGAFDFFIQYRPTVSNNLRVNTQLSNYTPYDFAWTPSNNTWYHIAVSRSGTDLKAFVDGTQIGTTQTDSSNISASINGSVGYNAQAQAQYLNGYIEDFRITKGLARYTANFTPPSASLDG